MAQNLVGNFNSMRDAQAALQALQALELGPGSIDLVPCKTDEAEVEQSRVLAQQAVEIAQAETGHVPEAELNMANRSVDDTGGAYIIVRTESDQIAGRAVEIMEQFHATDITGRSQSYKPGDWKHLEEQAVTETHHARTYESKPNTTA